MPWASSEVINVLAFLLPGFVAAATFHAFTSYPKPSAFERIILALIFTAIVQAILALLPESLPGAEVDIGEGTPWDPISPVVVAIVVAFVVVVAVNHNLVHEVLWRVRITRGTSHPSEWYSAFASYDDHYVVLHLDGERRLYGWPVEWPNDPAQGYFRIIDGDWLDAEAEVAGGETGGGRTNVDGILIPASEVGMVEFIRRQQRGSSPRRPSWSRYLRFPPRAR